MKYLHLSISMVLGIIAGAIIVPALISRLAPPHVDEATPPLLAEQILRDEWVRGVELWLEMVKGKHE
jgi:hypothetical protein